MADDFYDFAAIHLDPGFCWSGVCTRGMKREEGGGGAGYSGYPTIMEDPLGAMGSSGWERVWCSFRGTIFIALSVVVEGKSTLLLDVGKP